MLLNMLAINKDPVQVYPFYNYNIIPSYKILKIYKNYNKSGTAYAAEGRFRGYQHMNPKLQI